MRGVDELICDKMRTMRIPPLAAMISWVVVLTNQAPRPTSDRASDCQGGREPVPRRCGGFSTVTGCSRLGCALSSSSTDPNSLRSHRTVFRRRGETPSKKRLKILRCRVDLPPGRHPDRRQRIPPSPGICTIYQSDKVEFRRLSVRC